MCIRCRSIAHMFQYANKQGIKPWPNPPIYQGLKPRRLSGVLKYQNPNDPGEIRSPQRSDNGGNGNNTGGRGGSNGSNLLFRAVIFVVVAIIAYYLFMLFTQGNSSNANAVDIPYSLFIQQIKEGNVQSVTFQSQEGTGTLKKTVTVLGNSGKVSGNHFHVTLLPQADPTLTQLLIQHEVQFSAKPVAN